MQLAAIILTGGRSQRMGRPKESLPFLQSTLLARTVSTLRQCAKPVVVVRRDPTQELPELPPGVSVTHDLQPAAGPLAGLVAGLRFLRDQAGLEETDAAFVTGCDLPFLSVAAVQWLLAHLGNALLVMPRTDGVLQPLAAIYRLEVLAAAELMVQQGTRTPRSLATTPAARILDEAEVRRFDPELRFLRNVNTPADYKRALAEPPLPPGPGSKPA